MARTYEALRRATKDNLIGSDGIKLFDKEPQPRPNLAAALRVPAECVEEYHCMKQTITALRADRQIRTLLFCCSTEGEGNSTVLANFAMTMASEGDKVLLVDANLRTPAIHDICNLDQIGGFSDVLLGRSAVADTIKKTHISNLSVITCGTRSSNPFALLDSNRLPPFIEQMKTLADWVLFDAPPVIAYNDARVLAPHIDGVIMVIEAEKTRWEVVNSARQRIGNDTGKILGAVLNKRQMHVPHWVYNML
jgi:capsular exopolysaccharide synthesis family protein